MVDHVEDQPTDAVLLRDWADGVDQAGAALVGRYYYEMLAFLRTSVPDEDAVDTLHEIFLGVLESRENFRHHASFRTYLYRIARNKLADYYRKIYKEKNIGVFDTSENSVADVNADRVSSMVDRMQKISILVTCLRKIPVDHRWILELYYWNDADVSELAEIFEKSPGAVHTQLHRARQALAASVEAHRGAVVEFAEFEADLRELGPRFGVRCWRLTQDQSSNASSSRSEPS
jgi:RNA polymerase sigma-70 factor (ECF subfamily)